MVATAPLATKSWRAYLWAAASCGFTALIATPLRDRLDLANTVMLFLLAVVLVAVRLGRGPAVLAAFCSVALFDLFFVPPRFSFAVSDVQYLVTFAVMLTVALLISHLTADLAQKVHEAQTSERQTRSLYELAKALAGAMSEMQVLEAIARFLNENLNAGTTLLLPDEAEILRVVGTGQTTISLVGDYVVRAVLDSGDVMEVDDVAGGGGHSLLLPLKGSTRMRGVLVISVSPGNVDVLQRHRPLLLTLASLVAIAIERLHFVAVAQESQLQAASERLRSSILSALSHDVRTPLTVMYGLADSLTMTKPPLPLAAQETVAAIRDQAFRLNNMVGNLLDMARLQAGPVRLRKEWQPLEEVIGASIQLLGRSLQNHTIKLHLPDDLPLLEFDAVLMERVFCNLLENAAKYSPDAAEIEISAQKKETMIEITLCNGGSGFHSDRIARVFDLFERGSAESTLPGFGVGLAICRVIVEAHGGAIHAFNPASGGACISFTLPCGTPPQIEGELL